MSEFAKCLKWEREQHSWSQEQLAGLIGTTAPNVSRWERGITFPGRYFRQKLCETFGKAAEELHLLEAAHEHERPLPEQKAEQQDNPPSLAGVPSSLWNLPHQRNTLFTGREAILWRLHTALNSGRRGVLANPQAISGLGGIGKTELALEYAYRYGEQYQGVFWVRAETRDTLLADLSTIATALCLSEAGQQDPQQGARAVKRWFEQHTYWLLIVDNLEDLSLLLQFKGKGHLIVTTRSQATGPLVQCINLPKMDLDEGVLLLLRRAKKLGPRDTLEQASASDRTSARDICQLLDGLPLALDQAGAYIEESACSLPHYFQLLQRGGKLLGVRNLSSDRNSNHPHSVHATLSLLFEQLQQTNPAVMELLRLCAFLHPEAIPEEMILEGVSVLSPSLQETVSDPLMYDTMIAELRRHSLISRHPETRTFTMHRLVQVVLRDGMDEALQRQWATRAVQVVNCVFPDVDHWITSSLCQRYFLQAQVCATLIDQWDIDCVEAGRLLTQLSCYLYELAQYELPSYAQAEPLLKRALTLLRRHLGPEHPAVAEAQQLLGRVYTDLGDYIQAELYYQQALAIHECQLKLDHWQIACCLADLAENYEKQGKYASAEFLYQRIVALNERVRGPEHLGFAIHLRNMGKCYIRQKKYIQAEPILLRALTIWQQGIGVEHQMTASILSELGQLYLEQGEYTQAEAYLLQTLEIHQKLLKPGHPHLTSSLNILAQLYLEQEQYAQAESLLLQMWKSQQDSLGSESSEAAQLLNDLARRRSSKDELSHNQVAPPENLPNVLENARVSALYNSRVSSESEGNSRCLAS
ncbi:MAG: FxSxx-COOH system tetratricopeptide repeat protein [Ktedonobacteraceae bacterium]